MSLSEDYRDLYYCKKKYKLACKRLRHTQHIKKACEDAGYLQYYPHILDNIEEFKDSKRVLKNRIFHIKQKLHIKHVNLL